MALELLIALKYTEMALCKTEWNSSAIKTLLQLDKMTLQHSLRTSNLAVILGKKLGLSEGELKVLHQGALFHDIGKTRIPLEILNKEEPLTPLEWSTLQTHSQKGHECLKHCLVDQAVRRIVLNHHVWFNGEGGYPLGESKDRPCPLTQIVMVADVVDAMTSDRPYRKAHSITATREYIEGKAGSWFSDEVVVAFGRLVFKIEEKGWY